MTAKPQWEATREHRKNTQRKQGEVIKWLLELSSLRISIHRHIHYGPDVWLLSCPQLSIDKLELTSRSDEMAQEEVLNYIRKLLRQMLSELESVEEGV